MLAFNTRTVKQAAAVLAASAIVASAGSATPVITSPNSTASVVSFISTGPNTFEVTLRNDVAGAGLITIVGTDSNDVIEKITVLQRPGSTPGNDTLLLNISDDGASAQTPIKSINNIDVQNPGVTNLDISVLAITGDLGDSTNGGVIEAGTIRSVFLGGNWYVDAIVDPPISGQDIFGIEIDQDWIGGDLYVVDSEIRNIEVVGDIVGTVSDHVEIWSSTRIRVVEATNATEVQFGANAAAAPTRGSPAHQMSTESISQATTHSPPPDQPASMNSISLKSMATSTPISSSISPSRQQPNTKSAVRSPAPQPSHSRSTASKARSSSTV
ncbi:MAG: hypothetical protein AAGB34_04940 [Planctomycetota bacterium]